MDSKFDKSAFFLLHSMVNVACVDSNHGKQKSQ